MANTKRRKTAARSTGKRTAANSKKKQSKKTVDIQVVSMIIISILLAVLIYTNSGYIGSILGPFLGGIMGWMKYILPIGTFAIAIKIACEKKETLSFKLTRICSIFNVYSGYYVYISNINRKY